MAGAHERTLGCLNAYFGSRFDSRVVDVERMGPDSGGVTTAKVEGYGDPMRVTLARADGSRWSCVLHTARANGFGHDRRADRAQEQLLAFDTFSSVPQHVTALDVGAIDTEGRLLSLAHTTEYFLLTDWAEGTPYAHDLRRLAHGAPLEGLDLERVETLARYLARLHGRLPRDEVRWQRALRDTVGSGEGIFGIADAFDATAAGVTEERLRALEQRAVEWRWRLKPFGHRLSRTHGDFHPFNVVFRKGTDFTALDASRGCMGEPADDVTALAVNFVFFAVDHPERWRTHFSRLWQALWSTYLEQTGDAELLSCVGPFLAWRSLVVCCPRFYPHLSDAARNRLVWLAEQALAQPRFEPRLADELFR